MTAKPQLTKLNNIEVLIWDLDGTLYVPEKEFSDRMYDINIEILSRDLNIPFSEAEKLFEEKKQVYPSKTRLLADLTGRNLIELMKETESVKKAKYFHRDPKLIQMFKKLKTNNRFRESTSQTRSNTKQDSGNQPVKLDQKGYRNFILCNGYTDFVLMQIKALGLDPRIFEEIITADVTGTTKPSLEPFKHILTKTMLPPQAHLMIGDRPRVDLDPAKKLGMKTCLLRTPWNKATGGDYDLVIDEIYDLPQYLAEKQQPAQA